MNNESERLHLFAGYGIELEYMIVDSVSLDVRPIADEILRAAAGELTSDFENGDIAWSNELALHVLEIKTNGPATDLADLADLFQANVRRINEIADQFGAQLMPTAMHPWMDPMRELKLWPHEYNPVYEAYNRIFDCRGHGWANLQSTHINLPFANDAEFARLHAAIRLLLPLIPAISASSPVADGHITGFVDYRMEVYRQNSAKIPSIAGRIIPEPVYSEADYDREIFQRTYADIAPFDKDGILQKPFLNSRGAIARFERGAIEIRVVDIQECVSADIAIVKLIVGALKLLVEEVWVSLEEQKVIDVAPLAGLFLEVIRIGDRTVVKNPELLRVYGMDGHEASVEEIWRSLYKRINASVYGKTISSTSQKIIHSIFDKGCLSKRINQQVGGDSGLLHDIYGELCRCLQTNEMFEV